MMKTYLKRAFQLSDSGVKGLAKSIWSFFLYYVSVVVKRNGEKINTELAAQKTEKGYSLGLQLDYKAPLINVMDYNGENITKGSVLSYFSQGYWGLVSMVKIMVLSFADLFTGSVAVSELSGPIGVTTAVGSVYQEAARVSIWAVVLSMLNMVALLSVNLGIILRSRVAI